LGYGRRGDDEIGPPDVAGAMTNVHPEAERAQRAQDRRVAQIRARHLVTRRHQHACDGAHARSPHPHEVDPPPCRIKSLEAGGVQAHAPGSGHVQAPRAEQTLRTSAARLPAAAGCARSPMAVRMRASASSSNSSCPATSARRAASISASAITTAAPARSTIAALADWWSAVAKGYGTRI